MIQNDILLIEYEPQIANESHVMSHILKLYLVRDALRRPLLALHADLINGVVLRRLFTPQRHPLSSLRRFCFVFHVERRKDKKSARASDVLRTKVVSNDAES